ncbi:unnamed protein product, partial [Adineta ricciae]
MDRKNTNDDIASQLVFRADINFSDDDLSEEAKAQFTYHNEVLSVFQLNARIVLSNDRLSPTGRHLFCTKLEKEYKNYKSVLNYVAMHPENKIKTQAIHSPLILCGLPRTGTTLLFNLLACDPACRAPLLMDILHPIPPIARSDNDNQAQRNLFSSETSAMMDALGLANY